MKEEIGTALDFQRKVLNDKNIGSRKKKNDLESRMRQASDGARIAIVGSR